MEQKLYDKVDLTFFALSNYGPNREFHKALEEAMKEAEKKAIVDYIDRKWRFM